jgi:hypothetical protein
VDGEAIVDRWKRNIAEINGSSYFSVYAMSGFKIPEDICKSMADAIAQF